MKPKHLNILFYCEFHNLPHCSAVHLSNNGYYLQMEKCAIFIDGGYLNRVLDKFGKDISLDYLKFSEQICLDLNLNRLRTYFYHCLPFIRADNNHDMSRHRSMQKFLSKLKRLPRFEIKLGKLQLIGNQFRQKMVDVLMSLDIVNMCFDNKVQYVVLIAGDTDFVPAIKKAKDCGAIVHLFYHPKSIHNRLLDEVDELHIISEELINKCRIVK